MKAPNLRWLLAVNARTPPHHHLVDPAVLDSALRQWEHVRIRSDLPPPSATRPTRAAGRGIGTCTGQRSPAAHAPAPRRRLPARREDTDRLLRGCFEGELQRQPSSRESWRSACPRAAPSAPSPTSCSSARPASIGQGAAIQLRALEGRQRTSDLMSTCTTGRSRHDAADACPDHKLPGCCARLLLGFEDHYSTQSIRPGVRRRQRTQPGAPSCPRFRRIRCHQPARDGELAAEPDGSAVARLHAVDLKRAIDTSRQGRRGQRGRQPKTA